MLQTTLHRSIHINGKGLHSNREITVVLRPLTHNEGIWFRRSDLPESAAIRAVSENVSGTNLATSIGRGPEAISTIEHLMAAFGGLGVDNVLVEVSGAELPILDGSAAPWVAFIKEAGLKRLAAPRAFYVVRELFKLSCGDKSIAVAPSPSVRIDAEIDFKGAIGRQRRQLVLTEKTFEKELAPARTFCMMKDIEMMQSHGLALGGSLDNAVVVGDDGVMNPGGLRFRDEFVRHKMLDFVGDIALSGAPIIGAFTLIKPGHDLNQRFLAEALASGALELVHGEYRKGLPGFSRPAPQPALTIHTA